MSKVAYVSFIQPVNAETVNNLLKICNGAVSTEYSQLHLLISSQGGGMEVGFALYNQLLALPVDLITYNIGSVNSVANIIFLAGKKRISSPSSTFLLHQTFWSIPNQTELRHAQINEISESLLAEDSRLKSTILSRTTMDSGELGRFILKGTTLNAGEAKSHGIVHAIEEFQIPSGVELIQV